MNLEAIDNIQGLRINEVGDLEKKLKYKLSNLKRKIIKA